MHGYAGSDFVVVIDCEVDQSSKHHNNGKNQGDRLTAGIRKHELSNTDQL